MNRTTASVAGVECQRWEATEGGREPYTSGQEVGNQSKWGVLGGEGPNRAEVIFKSYSGFCDEKSPVGDKGGRRLSGLSTKFKWDMRVAERRVAGEMGKRGWRGQKRLLRQRKAPTHWLSSCREKLGLCSFHRAWTRAWHFVGD